MVIAKLQRLAKTAAVHATRRPSFAAVVDSRLSTRSKLSLKELDKHISMTMKAKDIITYFSLLDESPSSLSVCPDPSAIEKSLAGIV